MSLGTEGKRTSKAVPLPERAPWPPAFEQSRNGPDELLDDQLKQKKEERTDRVDWTMFASLA